jgi:hypothetical protein
MTYSPMPLPEVRLLLFYRKEGRGEAWVRSILTAGSTNNGGEKTNCPYWYIYPIPRGQGM